MRWPLLPGLVLLGLACSSSAPSPVVAPGPAASVASPSGNCQGDVQSVAGLKEVSDPELLQKAVGKPGEGKLCKAKVFESTEPVTVFRVWNKAVPWTQQGRWWSFERPPGPADAYRRDNAICPEWSALDTISQCRVKVGAHIVVGPGQSATCKETSFEASPINQVFIPNDGKSGVLFVEGCTPGDPWP